MHKYYILTILLLLGVQGASAQYALRGRVTDTEGEPLPYTRIYVSGIQRGILADEKGQYALSLPAGSYEVVFEYLGYETRTVPVEMRRSQTLDMVLTPVGISMGAVDITAGKRDPAYAIMEQVIAHKQNHIRDLSSFSRETYSKIRLERDTTLRPPKKIKKTEADSLKTDTTQITAADTRPPDTVPPGPSLVFLIESQSTGYFQAPGKFKSVIHAYRKHSDEGTPAVQVSFNDGQAFSDYELETDHPYLFDPDPTRVSINLYKNLIQLPGLGDQPWVSPLHSELWRVTYIYRLVDKTYEEGRVVYRIEVRPRNREGATVEGILTIIDGIWAIQAAELELMPSSLMFFNQFKLHHTYTRQDTYWTLAEETYAYEAKEGKDRFMGNTHAVHTSYQLNPTLARNFFGNEAVSVSQEAFERGADYWSQIRPVSLDSTELQFVQVQDSIIAFYNSPAYIEEQDSIYNRLTWVDIVFNGIGFRDRPRNMNYFLYPLVAQFRPLGIGGYRHVVGGTIDKTFKRYTALHLEGELDYGFNNQDLKGFIHLGSTYNPKRFARLDVRVGNVYSMVYPNQTITAVISSSNFINKRYIGLRHRFEVVNGLYLTGTIDFADRTSIDSLDEDQWRDVLFGDNNTPLSFDPYREMLIDIRIQYTPGQKYRMLPYRKVVIGSKWPTFQLHYKKAVPNFLGSTVDFDFLEFRVSQEVQLGTFGLTRWFITGGTFLRSKVLFFNDYTFFRGSDPWLFVNPLRNFQLLGRTLSTPNEFIAGHYVHDFGRILFNKVPLIRRTKAETSAGAGILWVRDSEFYHAEAFVGLQYPFRIRRQRFRLGAYFITAYGDYPQALNAQFKFGFSFYDPVKRRWEY